MKAIVILAIALLAGCASGPIEQFVAKDLEQAAKTAEAYGKLEAAKCWRDLAAYNAIPVVGAFSMIEKAKDAPLLDACLRR